LGGPDRPEAKAGGPLPQVRVVALAECGTHALIDALDGLSTGEQRLVPGLLRSFTPGMLVLADRNFSGCPLWTNAQATGAELCWRAKSNHLL
jgi:hypothetical protein